MNQNSFTVHVSQRSGAVHCRTVHVAPLHVKIHHLRDALSCYIDYQVHLLLRSFDFHC